jgi:hypothetical protein
LWSGATSRGPKWARVRGDREQPRPRGVALARAKAPAGGEGAHEGLGGEVVGGVAAEAVVQVAVHVGEVAIEDDAKRARLVHRSRDDVGIRWLPLAP